MPESEHDSRGLRLVFAGTPDFAAEALRALLASSHDVVAVYTQPDRPAGRGRKLKASPVKALALEHGLPVHQPESLKTPEAQRELAAIGADVMVVAAYGLLLPQAVLEAPRLGCINIHASLLPRWRGAAPIHRAILAGDSETGITIMQMDEGLDTGAMLLKRHTPIHEDDTAERLHDRLAELGGVAIVEALDALAAGRLQAEPQDPSLATYAKKLHKEEAALDWHRDAPALARQVRAFNPWPVATTTYGDKVLRIWQASALEAPAGEPPGTVVATDKAGIEVACGEGRLRLERLQMPGKKPTEAAQFLNAHDLTDVRLGNG